MIPEENMALLDLAVPYDAPKTVKMMDAAQPIAPKNDYNHLAIGEISYLCMDNMRTEYTGLKKSVSV